MKLPFKITRPFAVLDTETTGVKVSVDRIVSITILKFFSEEDFELKTMIIDPGIPLPKEASDIHGITDEVIAQKKLEGLAPTFKEVALMIFDYLENCDLCGYNAAFDVAILIEEFYRAGILNEFPSPGTVIADPMVIFKKYEQRNLAAALKFYCNEELEDAHNSTADTIAAFKVLIGQMAYYKELQGANVIDLAKECEPEQKRVDFAGKLVYNENGKVVFNFGKHYGKLVYDVFKENPTYYSKFLASSEDFTSDTQKHFKKYYDLTHPKK